MVNVSEEAKVCCLLRGFVGRESGLGLQAFQRLLCQQFLERWGGGEGERNGEDRINPYLVKYLKLGLERFRGGFEEWALKLELTISVCKV